MYLIHFLTFSYIFVLFCFIHFVLVNKTYSTITFTVRIINIKGVRFTATLMETNMYINF